MTFDAIDQLAVNTVRTLSMDAIQAANSGQSMDFQWGQHLWPMFFGITS